MQLYSYYITYGSGCATYIRGTDKMEIGLVPIWVKMMHSYNLL